MKLIELPNGTRIVREHITAIRADRFPGFQQVRKESSSQFQATEWVLVTVLLDTLSGVVKTGFERESLVSMEYPTKDSAREAQGFDDAVRKEYAKLSSELLRIAETEIFGGADDVD